jgi:hypothetical protein
LQSKTHGYAQNRFVLNRLAVVHGRLIMAALVFVWGLGAVLDSGRRKDADARSVHALQSD